HDQGQSFLWLFSSSFISGFEVRLCIKNRTRGKMCVMSDSVFDKIMSTREASKRWGLSQHQVKRLAREGKIIAKKLDEDDPTSPYLILKEQSGHLHPVF